QPGSTVGHYKILRRIGAGGMGVVYEAEDLRLGRHVALKLIAGNATPDPSALERFHREARIASSLNHPGICTIHEIDETGGQPFLIMELLDGQPLDRLYAGHPAPLPRLIEIGAQLADALEAAHRKGILHRDIKPANIFITSSGQAKILDFGLARIDSSPPSDSTESGIAEHDKLTRSGATLGTVAYMSPEQARGECLDARSDLFSLGVVLYEMATANHPFSGTTSAVVFDKLLNYHPPSPRSVNRDLPPDFENILNKSLEKDRDLRYQSASDLRADLRRLQRTSSGIHATGTPAAPAASYPGMIRVGASAEPAASAYPTPVPAAPLQLVPPRPRGPRFRPALFITGIAALIVTASAIAGIQYFAHKKAATVVATPSVTTTATKSAPPSSIPVVPSPTAAAAATAPPSSIPAAPTPAPIATSAAKPSASTPKPSAGTPKTGAALQHPIEPAPTSTATPTDGTPKTDAALPHMNEPTPPSTPAPTGPPVSSFAADAGAAPVGLGDPNAGAANGQLQPLQPTMLFRRAYAHAPSLMAHHLHHDGGFCEGTLQFTPETLNYTSNVHSFTLTRDQIVSISGDVVVESSGRRWRLEIPGGNERQVHNVLNRWLNALPNPH
ncbi:MAG: serine/threonine-protein kinase, partial [Acidobacteriaceae bacterium]